MEPTRALGVWFLHEVCQPPVVHQNFKSSKVLLDEKLSVRVADSGLAYMLPPRPTSQMAGYAAPEVEYGSYTCQSDVYSLGVVMLELLTGRRPSDRTRPRGHQTLAQWAIPRLHDIDALTRMVDPSLHGAYPKKSLSRFADIISRSLQCEETKHWIWGQQVCKLLYASPNQSVADLQKLYKDYSESLEPAQMLSTATYESSVQTTTLNNEHDWRNGLRVELFKQAVRKVCTEKTNYEGSRSREGHLEYLEVELIDSTNKSQRIDGFKRFKIIYHGPNNCSSSRRLPLLLKLKIMNLVARVLYLGV
uniref:Protein kinase domain-containing protein n=1 Tax=Brassica campestris TaxID=3711 RepID=M4D9X1_BRACM